jgi:phospholipid/cholesterol/gamma-HCH transport system substrate-binding protein
MPAPHSHVANVWLEFVGGVPTYTRQDLPEFTDDRGPNCYGLPHPGLVPKVQFQDGTQDDPRFAGSAQASAGTTLLSPSAIAGHGKPSAASPASSPSMGDAGTTVEKASFTNLLGPVMGVSAGQVPDVADLLWGPLLRGSTVALSGAGS